MITNFKNIFLVCIFCIIFSNNIFADSVTGKDIKNYTQSYIENYNNYYKLLEDKLRNTQINSKIEGTDIFISNKYFLYSYDGSGANVWVYDLEFKPGNALKAKMTINISNENGDFKITIDNINEKVNDAKDMESFVDQLFQSSIKIVLSEKKDSIMINLNKKIMDIFNLIEMQDILLKMDYMLTDKTVFQSDILVESKSEENLYSLEYDGVKIWIKANEFTKGFYVTDYESKDAKDISISFVNELIKLSQSQSYSDTIFNNANDFLSKIHDRIKLMVVLKLRSKLYGNVSQNISIVSKLDYDASQDQYELFYDKTKIFVKIPKIGSSIFITNYILEQNGNENDVINNFLNELKQIGEHELTILQYANHKIRKYDFDKLQNTFSMLNENNNQIPDKNIEIIYQDKPSALLYNPDYVYKLKFINESGVKINLLLRIMRSASDIVRYITVENINFDHYMLSLDEKINRIDSFLNELFDSNEKYYDPSITQNSLAKRQNGAVGAIFSTTLAILGGALVATHYVI